MQFNQEYSRMLGYQPGELQNLTYQELTPEYWHVFENGIVKTQILPNGYSEIYEKEYIRKDGVVFPVELRTFLMRDNTGSPSGMWAIVRDISERKKIERSLSESEARYRELLDASLQGVFVFQDMQIVYANRAATESYGYTSDELRSLTPDEIIMRIHPEDRQMVQERLQRRPEAISSSERYPVKIFHKSGEIRWLEAMTVPIVFQGKLAVITTFIDVSGIRQVEAELRESERTLRTLLNASDAMVFLADTNRAIISANEKTIRRLGLSAETVVGAVVHELFPDNEITRVRKNYFNRVVSSGKPITFDDSHDGIWFENSFYPILDESGKVTRLAAYIRDITEQKRVEAELRESGRIQRTILDASRALVMLVDVNGGSFLPMKDFYIG